MKENTLDLQLPNLRGHACPSMGKSTSFIGHSALIVSLFENTRVFVMEHVQVQTCPCMLQAATEDVGILSYYPVFGIEKKGLTYCFIQLIDLKEIKENIFSLFSTFIDPKASL